MSSIRAGRLVGQAFDGAPTEALALHRGSLEHLPLLAREQVEPGGEENLDRRRHRQLAHLSGRPTSSRRRLRIRSSSSRSATISSTKSGLPPAARSILIRQIGLDLAAPEEVPGEPAGLRRP